MSRIKCWMSCCCCCCLPNFSSLASPRLPEWKRSRLVCWQFYCDTDTVSNPPIVNTLISKHALSAQPDKADGPKELYFFFSLLLCLSEEDGQWSANDSPGNRYSGATGFAHAKSGPRRVVKWISHLRVCLLHITVLLLLLFCVSVNCKPGRGFSGLCCF